MRWRRSLPAATSMLALALVLLCPTLARAGTVTGHVYDGMTLKTIKDATLVVDGEKSVVSDEIGAFDLGQLAVGVHQIKITAKGYEPSEEMLEVAEANISDATFLLFATGGLGEVVTVKGEPPAPPPVGKQNLTREEITRIPGTRGDALQSIRSLPGVSNAQPGVLIIRGSNPDDSYVAIDGVQVPILYHFFGLQSVLPSEFIQNIEFSPGGFGAEEGRATGGVINVITRSEPIAKANGFVELSFINAAALMQTPLSKQHNVQMSAAIRRSLIDFILPAVLPESVNLTAAPTYYDSQVRVDWRPKSGHRLSMLALGSLDNLELINNNIDPNDPVASNATFRNETGFYRAIATWEYGRGKTLNRLIFSGGQSEFEFVVANRFLKFGQKVLEFRDDFNYKLSDRIRIRAGAMARLDSRSLNLRFPPQPQEGEPPPTSLSTGPLLEYSDNPGASVAGTYAAVDLKPTATLTVTSGVRLDYYNHIGDVMLAPRVQAAYAVTKQTTVRASLGAYNRPLEQAQSVPTNLDPEQAFQYVLGAERQMSDGISLQATGFYTDRRRLVVRDPVLAQTDPLFAYVNRGRGRSFGGELMLRLRRDRMFGWLAYTLQRSDRIDQPLSMRRLFDVDQTHNLVAVASYKLGKWEFGGRFQYATGNPLTPIVGSQYLADANIYVPTYGAVNSTRQEAAHQLDIRIDRRFTAGRVKLAAFLDITNVYAHAQVLGYNYNFDYTQRTAFTNIPIFPAIGLRGAI